MKKGKYLLLFAALFLLLTMFGCAKVDETVANAMLSKSGIHWDEGYKQYKEMNEAGQLGEDGTFIDTDIVDEAELSEELEETPRGDIHITFADNRYLNINYYYDADLKESVDTSSCYLNPGESIYSSVESKNVYSNRYGISNYRIYDYSNGDRKIVAERKANSSLVYTVPADFAGTELQIVPVGEYPARALTMSAYYIDEAGRKQPLTGAGKWYINGEECKSNEERISPIVSYTLKYDFDEENYFYIESSPTSFTKDPQSAGIVEFWEVNPNDEEKEYSVQLHRYLSLTIELKETATLTINDGVTENLKKGSEWSSKKLKYGDKIVIDTNGECMLSQGDFQHVQATKDPLTSGYRYTFVIAPNGFNEVVETNDYITLTLTPNGKYGKCIYTLDGKKVEGTKTVQKNQKLEIKYTITDNKFKFSDATIWNAITDWVGNMSKTVQIPLSVDMNNTSIDPDAYFDIIPK